MPRNDNAHRIGVLVRDMFNQHVLDTGSGLAHALNGNKQGEAAAALWRPTGGLLMYDGSWWWTDARSPTATRLSNATKCFKGLWQDPGYDFLTQRHHALWVANGQAKFYVAKTLIQASHNKRITGGYGRVSKSKYKP